MRKVSIIILALILLFALAGCSGGTGAEDANSAAASPPVSTSTPAPDYSNTDFSGHWGVYGVYDSTGEPVTGSALEALQPSFTLELLADGLYFVYDSTGAVLGQGNYTVAGDVMTLTADDKQTVYSIADENTLGCTADDGSVTVMTRLPEEPGEDAEDTGDTCEDDSASGDDTDVPEETDVTETPEETPAEQTPVDDAPASEPAVTDGE